MEVLGTWRKKERWALKRRYMGRGKVRIVKERQMLTRQTELQQTSSLIQTMCITMCIILFMEVLWYNV